MLHQPVESRITLPGKAEGIETISFLIKQVGGQGIVFGSLCGTLHILYLFADTGGIFQLRVHQHALLMYRVVQFRPRFGRCGFGIGKNPVKTRKHFERLFVIPLAMIKRRRVDRTYHSFISLGTRCKSIVRLEETITCLDIFLIIQACLRLLHQLVTARLRTCR